MKQHLKNSDDIEKRLRDEAKSFSRAEERLGTIDRLVAACDALEKGMVQRSLTRGLSARRRHATEKINPTNIDSYVRHMGWPGPTRTFISNRRNGLIDYVRAREDERALGAGRLKRPKHPEDESYIDRIPDIEIRQFVRFEIERRKQTQRELDLLRNALSQLPGLTLSDLLSGVSTKNQTSPMADGRRLDLDASKYSQISNLVTRLNDVNNLRHLGLKYDSGDIVSLNNALVISAAELTALRAFVNQDAP